MKKITTKSLMINGFFGFLLCFNVLHNSPVHALTSNDVKTPEQAEAEKKAQEARDAEEAYRVKETAEYKAKMDAYNKMIEEKYKNYWASVKADGEVAKKEKASAEAQAAATKKAEEAYRIAETEAYKAKMEAYNKKIEEKYKNYLAQVKKDAETAKKEKAAAEKKAAQTKALELAYQQKETALYAAKIKAINAAAGKGSRVALSDHKAGYIPFLGKTSSSAQDKPYEIMDMSQRTNQDAKAVSTADNKAKSDAIKAIGGSDEFGIDIAGVNKFKSSAQKIAQVVVSLVFGFSVIMICLAGFKFAMSEGDSRRLREAKMQIIAAGIGLGIGLMTLIIVKVFKEIIMFQNK